MLSIIWAVLSHAAPLLSLLPHTPTLQASFPAGLAAYPNLALLDLENTTLSGPLPEVPQGSFPSLVMLLASTNALTGTIPDSWQDTYLFSRVRAFLYIFCRIDGRNLTQ